MTKPAVPCARGYYCPEGTSTPDQFPCPAGSYSWRTDLIHQDECFACPAGSYCEEGSIEPTGVCDAGYYCEASSTTAMQAECPAGTYSSTTGLKTSAECLTCPMGHYCNNDVDNGAGLTGVNQCPEGSYNPFTNIGYPDEATATAAGSTRFCMPCPAGYYCPNLGTVVPTACGTGKYSPEGQIECTSCEAGYICKLTATADTDKEPCAAGYHCEASFELAYEPQHIDTTYSCPPGYYCGDGTVAAVACPAGYYQPTYGAIDVSECLEVPKGYYTAAVGQGDFYSNKCEPGFYCPANTGNTKTNTCPYATFRATPGAEDED